MLSGPKKSFDPWIDYFGWLIDVSHISLVHRTELKTWWLQFKAASCSNSVVLVTFTMIAALPADSDVSQNSQHPFSPSSGLHGCPPRLPIPRRDISAAAVLLPGQTRSWTEQTPEVKAPPHPPAFTFPPPSSRAKESESQPTESHEKSPGTTPSMPRTESRRGSESLRQPPANAPRCVQDMLVHESNDSFGDKKTTVKTWEKLKVEFQKIK